MRTYMIAGIALITLGVLGLVYDHFSYTKESEGANLGPIELTIKEKKTVNVPTWAGVASIAAGAAALTFGYVKR